MLLEYLTTGFLFMLTVSGPAVLIARLWEGDVLEGFVIGIGAFIIDLYVLMLLVRELGIPLPWLHGVPVLSAILLLANWRWCRTELNRKEIREVLMSLCLFYLWSFWALSQVQVYSGGGWAIDWAEHYERALFFIEPISLDHAFAGRYPFTARPPAGNALSAFFLALSGTGFGHFQMTSMMAGGLVFLPACLLLRDFGKQAAWPGAVFLLLLLFMVNPMVMQNILYPWTRMLTAFYVLTAIHLYWKSCHGGNALAGKILAFLFLAGGMLVHYSAGPYIVAFVVLYFLEYRYQFFSLSFWKQTMGIALACACLMSLWFGWALFHFGIAGTFFTNTTVTETQDFSFTENVLKVFYNVFNTLVPHPLRLNDGLSSRLPADPLYAVRDYFFWIYQVSLLPAVGILSWLVLGIHYRKHWVSFRILKCPVFLFAVVVILAGVAVHGSYSPTGLAHICLQPLVLGAVISVAAVFPLLKSSLKLLLFLGLGLDFILGVAIQWHVLSRPLTDLVLLLTNEANYPFIKEEFGAAVLSNSFLQFHAGVSLISQQMAVHALLFWAGIILMLGLVVVLILGRGRLGTRRVRNS